MDGETERGEGKVTREQEAGMGKGGMGDKKEKWRVLEKKEGRKGEKRQGKGRQG